MPLSDYLKGISKPSTTTYNSLVQSPIKSSGTPLIAPAPPMPSSPRSSPSPYIAPVQNYVPYTPPVNNYQRSVGGGAVNTGASQAPVAPPAPPKPPINYEEVYNTDDKVAGVDSTFGLQRQQYQNSLDKFLLEDTRQRGDVQRDHDTAIDGIGRNQTAGLTSMNEDFAARGLGRSGLRLNAVQEATDQYDRQRTSVRDGLTKSLGDLTARKEKMQTDTTNSIAAARREAYARLAAKQELT